MGNKNIKKWENYVTEIKQEYYDKLNQYVAIENNGDNKNSKAFRLKKNGHDTNIFRKINENDEQNDDINSEFNINIQNEGDIIGDD